MTTAQREIIIKDTHRGLKYVDGVLTGVLGAGRHELPKPRLFGRTPEGRGRPRGHAEPRPDHQGAGNPDRRQGGNPGQHPRAVRGDRPEGGRPHRRELRGPAVQRRAARRPPVAGRDDPGGHPHQPHPAERGHPARCEGGGRRVRGGDRPGGREGPRLPGEPPGDHEQGAGGRADQPGPTGRGPDPGRRPADRRPDQGRRRPGSGGGRRRGRPGAGRGGCRGDPAEGPGRAAGGRGAEQGGRRVRRPPVADAAGGAGRLRDLGRERERPHLPRLQGAGANGDAKEE